MSKRQDRFFSRRSGPFFGLLVCMGLSLSAHPAAPALAADPAPTPEWRPVLHYTPQAHWMNDPNGPFLLDGVWHLFYQYNPNAMVWGHTSWGHATSRDLVHWQELPVALPATPQRDIFSGSVVIDSANHSGLGPKGTSPLVALYTSVFNNDPAHPDGTQAQSLAYSLDGARTWHSHGTAPVLTLNPDSKQFRDPSVMWYAPGQYWVMTSVVADAQVVKLYRSTDLVHWDFLSDFQPTGYRKPGMLWEMPSLISLPLDGRADDRRWVMIVSVNPWSIAGGSGVEYFTGHFDGTHFIADAQPAEGADPAAYHWLDHGADNYAAIGFANAGSDAPCLISWMSNWDYADRLPTSPWRGQMTLPVTLTLRTLDGTPHLFQNPARPYERVVAQHTARSWAQRSLTSGSEWPLQERYTVADITLTLRGNGRGQAGIVLRQSADGQEGTRVSYDFASELLTLDRGHSGRTDFSDKFSRVHVAHLAAMHGSVTLHIVMDRSSVEIFANEGALRMTDLIFPHRDSDRVSLFATGATARLEKLRITRLDP